jgi:hypothetical protein
MNVVVESGKTCNITNNNFKNCVIFGSGGGGSDVDVEGGAIYIEVKMGGKFHIEGKYDNNIDSDNTYTFTECGVLVENGGWGGALSIYLDDGITDSNIKLSGEL